MKRTAALLLTIIALLPLHASSGWLIGGEAGYALSFMSTVNTWPDTLYKPGHGAEAAFLAEYGFGYGLSLSAGLRYSQKSFFYSHTNGGDLISDYMEMNHFLEVPLSIRYSCSFGDVSLFAGAGGYVGIWFLSNWAGRNISASETMDSSSNMYMSFGELVPLESQDNLFEAGILAEAGVSWHMRKDIRLDFTLRYEGNLTSLVRNVQENTVHRYYDTLMLTVGCMIPVGGGR